jgi:UDP-N-acetylglucosamine 4-epimerase
VQANILAATAGDAGKNQVYNVALGDRTTLNELFSSLASALNSNDVKYTKDSIYREFRAGDVRHSQADISKAKEILGYEPEFRIQQGIDKAMPWYIKFLTKFS